MARLSRPAFWVLARQRTGPPSHDHISARERPLARYWTLVANPQELLELPGIHEADGDAIIRHRGQHGPIRDAIELTQILGPEIVTAGLLAHVDFQPAEATAAEAPGA